MGRLIGPGGATMKGLQELTNTKMAVLGKGSVREADRKKVCHTILSMSALPDLTAIVASMPRPRN